MNRYRVFVGLAVALFIAAMGIAGAAWADDGKLSLSGTGEVYATPDMATLSIGVVSQEDTAGAALRINNESMEKITAAMKSSGVADRDLQTSGFSVNPVYTAVLDNRNNRTGEQIITGYRVNNTLMVRIRNLDDLGRILDEAVGLGANSISGPSFGVSEPKALENEARRAAVANALEKANLYAEAAGVRLGSIIKIEEHSMGRPQPVMMRQAAPEMAFDSAVPIATGELTFRSDIVIEWELDD